MRQAPDLFFMSVCPLLTFFTSRGGPKWTLTKSTRWPFFEKRLLLTILKNLISIFTQAHPSLIDNGTFEAETIPILHRAIQNNSFGVVDHLLDQQTPMRPFLFQEATKNSSYRVSESFPNHGFDINTPIDINNPPAIA